MPVATMRQLLEAGIHFGHQTRRWHPKMAPYIFGQRNGIYIIDLQKTLAQLHKAYNCVRDTVARGGTVLFVGTKKQAQEAIPREAQRCGMYYVRNRWLGGMLTNWATIRESIKILQKLERMDEEDQFEKLPKKEAIQLRKHRERLDKNLCGIKDMPGLPAVLFIIDAKKEAIAVREAERMEITSIAVVDTNCDPARVSIPIPGNDDALRAVNLFCSVIADAVLEGRMAADEGASGAADTPGDKELAVAAGSKSVESEQLETVETEPEPEPEDEKAEVAGTDASETGGAGE